jgi:hypothetical protein
MQSRLREDIQVQCEELKQMGIEEEMHVDKDPSSLMGNPVMMAEYVSSLVLDSVENNKPSELIHVHRFLFGGLK